jgi:hypothetical protein
MDRANTLPPARQSCSTEEHIPARQSFLYNISEYVPLEFEPDQDTLLELFKEKHPFEPIHPSDGDHKPLLFTYSGPEKHIKVTYHCNTKDLDSDHISPGYGIDPKLEKCRACEKLMLSSEADMQEVQRINAKLKDASDNADELWGIVRTETPDRMEDSDVESSFKEISRRKGRTG